jgi:hypothetical protein
MEQPLVQWQLVLVVLAAGQRKLGVSGSAAVRPDSTAQRASSAAKALSCRMPRSSRAGE